MLDVFVFLGSLPCIRLEVEPKREHSAPVTERSFPLQRAFGLRVCSSLFREHRRGSISPASQFRCSSAFAAVFFFSVKQASMATYLEITFSDVYRR